MDSRLDIYSHPLTIKFLKRITETVEVKSKIFGALAPSKHELTGKNGAPLVPSTLDFKKLAPFLSDDDLKTLDQAGQIIERAQRALNHPGLYDVLRWAELAQRLDDRPGHLGQWRALDQVQ